MYHRADHQRDVAFLFSSFIVGDVDYNDNVFVMTTNVEH